MTVVTSPEWLNLIVVGLLFGFGFAIAQSLWSALVAGARKVRG